RQAFYAKRVTGGEHQPLGTHDEGDHPLLLGAQPGLDAAHARRAEWPGWYVQAGHLAVVALQGNHRVVAAAKLHVPLPAGVTLQPLAQRRHGKTVAGVDAQARGAGLDRKSTRLNSSHVKISYA